MTCCPEIDSIPFIEKFPENHQIIFLTQIFCTDDPGSCLDLISFEVSDLSDRSASINSSSADYPVLADCSLVFQSYLLKVFNLGSLLKVPWFELSNSSLCLF